MYSMTVQRAVGKRTNDDKIKTQVAMLLGRGLDGSRGKTWEGSFTEVRRPVQNSRGFWVFTYRIDFKKVSGQRGGEAEYKQWQEIKAMVEQTGQHTRFAGQNWLVVAVDDSGNEQYQAASQPAPQIEADAPIEPADFTEPVSGITGIMTSLMGVREVQPFGIAKKWNELVVPPELIGADSDRYLAEHPAWKNLYGVNPQIRIVLSNIKRAQETDGESRNHAVLFGHAGCGKTTTMFALEQMFGSDSVLKLDATSTTKAGLEKLFFSDLTEIPPLVFMEEAEKADPEALKIWLGALDDRGEIRKVNFRVNQLRAVKVLFICTVNNKAVFDRMMGSDGTEAGALSSRCVTQVYYPRPSDAVLFQILEKEIHEKGGDPNWIVPAIDIAKELNVTDPRTVRSYLAGGDRLLDGTYKRDWMAVHEAQKAFNK